MSSHEKYDTHRKALALNLDHTIFGSFAETGAGQEVARWFLRVGGASGTVAKSISAYDKGISDQLYGIGTRYVSKARVQAISTPSGYNCLDNSRPAAELTPSFSHSWIVFLPEITRERMIVMGGWGYVSRGCRVEGPMK